MKHFRYSFKMSIVLATSFNISIIHGRVSTDHAPYTSKIYTEHSKQEGGGRVDWN